MSLLRYLGIVVGDAGDLASLPAQPGLGRFVAVGEPLPVGSLIDVDGVSHRVTRVDEGVVPGCWLRAEGAAAEAADEMPTLREIVASPEQDTPQAIAPSAVAPAAVAASESSVSSEAGTPEAGTPEAGTPEAGTPEAGTPEAGTPELVASEVTTEAGGKKRGKRRGAKTIIGR